MKKELDLFSIFSNKSFPIDDMEGLLIKMGVEPKVLIRSIFKFLNSFATSYRVCPNYYKVLDNALAFLAFLCEREEFTREEIDVNRKRIKKLRETLLTISKNKSNRIIAGYASQLDEIVLDKGANTKDIMILILELINRKESTNIIKKIININKGVINYNNGELFYHVFNLAIKAIQDESEDIYYYLTLLKLVYYSKINKKAFVETLDSSVEADNVFSKEIYLIINGVKRGLSTEEILDKYDVISDFEASSIFVPKKKSIVEPVFTIDRSTTSSRDDGFSVTKDGDNYLVGIHIADVGKAIEVGGIQDLQALNNYKCCYMAGGNRTGMFDPGIESKLSLNAGHTRNVISLYVRLNPYGEILDYYVTKNSVVVAYNLSYKQSEDIINRITYSGIEEAFNVLTNLSYMLEMRNAAKRKYWDTKEKNSPKNYHGNTKSEKIVQELMVLYNTILAEIAKDASFPYIYRTQEKEYISGLVDELHLSLDDYNRKMISEIYLPSKYSTTPALHSGLNVPAYSHSVAPMRRYPDTFNQYLLHKFYFKDKDFVFDDQRFEELVTYFNQRNSEMEFMKADYNREYKLIKRKN